MPDSNAKYAQPLPYTSFGGPDPRWDNPYWWNEVTRWTVGVQFHPNYAAEIGGPRLRWGLPGWMYDVYTLWHRARYGWAPRDTWSLDCHLNKVMAGTLEHLAHHSHGVPGGFPEGAEFKPNDQDMLSAEAEDDVDARFALWQAKLLAWAKAFSEDPQDVDIYDAEDGYVKHRAEEERRREALHKALKEIEVMYEALWD